MRGAHLPSLCGLVLSVTALASGCNEPIEKLWQYRSHSASYSSPAVGEGIIVFGTASGEVHATTKDGGFLWKFQTRKEVISAPEIWNNLILFGSTNHNFYALDLKGKQVWRYTTFDRIKGDPLVVDGTVYFGSYDEHLYALDAVTRAEKWIFPPHEAPKAKEAGGEGGEKAAKEVDRSLWPTRAFAYPQPTLTSDGLIVIGNLDGHVYAVDTKTGQEFWRFKTRDKVEADPVIDGNRFYIASGDKNLYAFRIHKTQKRGPLRRCAPR